jgi:trimethylamine--corrinoid protein Co-methyltransferase
MNSGGMIGGQYKPLTDDQIEKIHETALTILEEVGFTYETGLEETLDMLAAAGARVERANQRIFFPRALVEEQAQIAPANVILYSRDGKNDLNMSGNRVHMGTGGQAIKVVDLETGKSRQSVLSDVHNVARLVERLDNIHFFQRPCTAHDISPEAHDKNVFYAGLTGTHKHYMGGAKDESVFQDVFKMAAMVVGSEEELMQRPIISISSCFAISPLKLCTQSTLIVQAACRHLIPVALSSAPMAGSTSPRTMAGTLALLHAEELVGVTIGQLSRPGAPLLYGGIPGVANMRTMNYSGGGAEFGMMNAAIHQMADHIKVPNYNSSGLSDSKMPDIQAAWEKALTTLLAAMGGSNFIHHSAGMLESMLTIAYEQYVIDDEINGMSAKVLKGIEVDDDHLALDAIAEVGPGGNFIMSNHTLKFLRSEFYEGNGLSDRSNRDEWEAGGSVNAHERAKQMVRDILAEDRPDCISEEVSKSLKEHFDVRKS